MTKEKPSGNPLRKYGMGVHIDDDDKQYITLCLDHTKGLETIFVLYHALNGRSHTKDIADSLKRVLLNFERYIAIDELEAKMDKYEAETGLPYICSFGITLDDLASLGDPEMIALRDAKRKEGKC